MTTQPETIILNRIRKSLKDMGCKAIKIHGDAFTEKGTADVIGSYQGLCFVIEVKVPGEDATLIQEIRLEEWQKAGARVGVAHNVDEALNIVLGVTKWSKSR